MKQQEVTFQWDRYEKGLVSTQDTFKYAALGEM